jgi:hypothetical protein
MEFQNINRGYDGIRDEINENLLEAFFDGKTGFPLVDACIRCLKSTGYINFRMRAMWFHLPHTIFGCPGNPYQSFWLSIFWILSQAFTTHKFRCRPGPPEPTPLEFTIR